jgi:CheY-like chemotaxis protein
MARIFLIDDDPPILKIMSQILQSRGHQASTFTSADELLPRLAELPDVLICDLRLPGADGLTVAEETRRVSPLTRIVLCSGADGDELAAALERGIVDHAVMKPWRAADLLGAIESLIATPRAAKG